MLGSGALLPNTVEYTNPERSGCNLEINCLAPGF